MAVIIFIFGLIIGSFLNCVIYRLESKKSFLKGRSFCPSCKHTLGFWDLIPVFSFVFLKGKCRYCAKKISPQYPLVELMTGAIFFLIFNLKFEILNQFEMFQFKNFVNLSFLLVIYSLLIVIFVYDLKHFIIPDSVLFSAIIIVFIWKLISNFEFQISNLVNPLISAVGACLFFLAIFLITRGKGMGFGDVKLAFFMGLFLGFPNIIVSLFFAFLIGAIIGIGLVIAKKKGLKSEVPFGPFLLTGLLIAFLWGGYIFNWYMNLIL